MRLAKLRKLGRPIVPRDLRNPTRKSGFDHVNSANPGADRPNRYWRASAQADKGAAGKTHGRVKGSIKWRGPSRSTPLEAAQDFCDRFNGNPSVSNHSLATAGHEYMIDPTDKDPEYQEALGVLRDRTAQRKGKQDYLYMMIETEYEPGRPTGGALTLCKVGHSTNPRKRLAEVQAHNPRRLALLYVKPLPPGEDDKPTHRRHIKANVLHEWFYPTKALLLEFKPEHEHTDQRAYTEAEKAKKETA